MKLGLDHYTIAHRNLNASQVLAFVRSLGLEGVQFLEPAWLSPVLRPKELLKVRDEARELGLYLEIGIPSPNPVHRSRVEGREITCAEQAAYLILQIEAAALLGMSHVRAYIGDRHARFRTDIRWQTQLDASCDVIQRIAPVLRSNGLRIAIETHADLTVVELLRLLDRLGTDIAGVTLDTGNLLMRLEDPLSAAERLAPYVLSTHLKDAVLARTSRGYCWQARPVGSGVVPIPEILRLLGKANPDLNLSVELHPRTYDLPILDPEWLSYFPELTPQALQKVEQYADLCESRYNNKDGALARPEVVEALPWADRDLDWIRQSIAELRRILDSQTLTDPQPSAQQPV